MLLGWWDSVGLVEVWEGGGEVTREEPEVGRRKLGRF